MKRAFYANEETFPKTHQQQLRLATRLVARLSGRDRLDRYVRCHELARAVLPSLSPYWRLVDGRVGPVDHSWLSDPMLRVVLDLYTPTRLPQVQLVHVGVHFQLDLYRPGTRRRDIRWSVVGDLKRALE